jgi:glycosyltransferase 2 family protein
MKYSASALAKGEQAGAPPAKSRRERVYLLLGLLLSSAFLYLVLRGVNPSLLWRQLRSVNPLLIVAAILIGSSSNLVRAVRWKVLLAEPAPIRFRHLFSSMMIGYMANNVLPARMGELVRVYLLKRKAGVSKSRAAATIVIERIIDALLLLSVVVAISVFLPLPALLRKSGLIAGVAFAGTGIVLLLLAFTGESAARQTGRIVGTVSQTLGKRTEQILVRFVQGLVALRSIRQISYVVLLTLAIWTLEAIAVGLVIGALNLSLPWIAAPFLLVVLSLSFVLPAAPGGMGTYEFFVVAAIAPFGLDNSSAVGLALVLHAIMYFTSGTLGLASLWTERLSLRELTQKGSAFG